MKKILLFLLLFAGMANAQIVSIPDIAFHAKLLALGVDTNSDGAIQQSEALAVTSLDLRSSNIAVLSGIEAFTNLTSLDCNFNLLSVFNYPSLTNLTTLNCQSNQITLLNVAGLPNLQNLNCAINRLTTLNVTGLINLQKLNCSMNELAALDVTGLNLQQLTIGHNPMTSLSAVTGISPSLEWLGCEGLNLTSINVSAFPNLKALSVVQNLLPSFNAITGLTSNIEELYLFSNQMTTLDVTGFPNLKKLYCDNNQLTSINTSGLTNLELLRCGQNSLTSLNVTGLTALTSLDFSNTQITSINLSGLTNLVQLSTQFTPFTLNITGLTNLESLVCSYDQITGVDFTSNTNLTSIYIYGGSGPAVLNLTGLSSITSLNCGGLGLTDINLTGLTNLKHLICNGNQLTNLNLSGLTNLETLVFRSNLLTSVDLTGLNNIQVLDCGQNQMSSLDVSGMANLKQLYCNNNQFSALDLTNNTNLFELICYDNAITSLDVSGLVNLLALQCFDNQLTILDVSNNSKLNALWAFDNQLTTLTLPATNLNLHDLQYGNNPLPNLDFSNYTELTRLDMYNTGRSSLNVSSLTKLFYLTCMDNPIPSVDVTNNYKLEDLGCGSPELTQLFMKNGSDENFTLTTSPNLAFVCTDESQTQAVQDIIFGTGNLTAVVNSYCSFVPGGNYNTITGAMLFDANANGCDANDIQQPNIKIKINDGTTIGDTFTNTTGNYSFYTLAGNFTITPEVENASFFNFSPSTATIPFANNNNNVTNQSFCINANGVHPDIEIVITPDGPARPGFDAVYKIVYKNIGNQILSGDISFNYDDAVLDFVSASQVPNTTSTGSMTWNYTNLLPFENRVYNVTLNVNSPVETPAVQINDILVFSANANPLIGDENSSNNTFSLNQLVTGSFDPNSKTCLEGAVVSSTGIGDYLHYNIEFENLGNAEAVNVVVKDVIDTTMFDISSLQILYASHEMRATVRGNVAEFIFEGINLPSAEGTPPVGGHGNVLFKIKTLSTLTAGTQVENKANIYFDYNHPIETDTARTTFQTLSNPEHPVDESIVLYPNPAKDHIFISCNSLITSVELYDVQGRMLQTAIQDDNTAQLDISNYAKGVYFVRINTENGMKVVQMIKE
jgi:uncharacterized repeat protein (TIGR01451 family)